MPITYETYWDDIVELEEINLLNGNPAFTFDELLAKLAQARSTYPVLRGE